MRQQGAWRIGLGAGGQGKTHCPCSQRGVAKARNRPRDSRQSGGARRERRVLGWGCRLVLSLCWVTLWGRARGRPAGQVFVPGLCGRRLDGPGGLSSSGDNSLTRSLPSLPPADGEAHHHANNVSTPSRRPPLPPTTTGCFGHSPVRCSSGPLAGPWQRCVSPDWVGWGGLKERERGMQDDACVSLGPCHAARQLTPPSNLHTNHRARSRSGKCRGWWRRTTTSRYVACGEKGGDWIGGLQCMRECVRRPGMSCPTSISWTRRLLILAPPHLTPTPTTTPNNNKHTGMERAAGDHREDLQVRRHHHPFPPGPGPHLPRLHLLCHEGRTGT